MVSGESPAVARRRLRLALRKAREAKGFTQGYVADALEWSLSKVNRIESGEVTVSSTDLRALLGLLGISGGEQLMDDARASRRRGWWDEQQYREYLTPAMLQLLQFESEATVIRSFQSTLIPGVLQTREYAESVVNFWSEELGEAARAARLEVRMLRRAQVFGRPDPPQYLLILDESVLYRSVGGPKVMAEQLREMLAVMEHPEIIVRVLPLADAAVMATLGPFTIFDLGDEEDAVLYRESYLQDEIVHASGTVRRHRRIFEQIWEQLLNREDSARLIQHHAEAMLSRLDTGQHT
jgi:transcriptional regulator with XRE-family HTH domain